MGLSKLRVSGTSCLSATSGHLCLLRPGAQSPCLHHHSHGTALVWHCKLPTPVPQFPCWLLALPVAGAP